MPKEITSSAAAERAGTTRHGINQAIRRGLIEARLETTPVRHYLVDVKSLEKYLKNRPKPGRRAKEKGRNRG